MKFWVGENRRYYDKERDNNEKVLIFNILSPMASNLL